MFGISIDPALYLPPDPTVEGFDNVGEALRISPVFLEQSINSARNIVARAVGNRVPRAGGTVYRAEPGSQYAHVHGAPLGTRGGVVADHNFPADGEYVLNIGDMARAVWVFNQEFTHTLIATYDGERFFELDIAGGDDLKAIDQLGDVAVDAINARLKSIPFHAEAGMHRLAVTFVHRSFAEYEGDLQPMIPGEAQTVLPLGLFEVQGPFEGTGASDTPARQMIFSCYPERADQQAACAAEIIGRFARKAYRGEVAEADIALLMQDFQAGSAGGDFEEGVRRALTALIASPKFLFRQESVPADAAPGTVHALKPLELASRLSFFLWSSIPDERLLELAESGQLLEPAVLEDELRRMLADPRAENLAQNFAYQWLNLGAMDDIVPDPVLFADVDPGIRELFKREALLFIADIFLSDSGVADLLDSPDTFLNERLALHYGLNNVKGDAFRRVRLDDSARWGLLGKGGVLLVSSYPDRTSPVLRGAYILSHLKGTPPAPPPPSVEALLENSPGRVQLTVRERLELHRSNPSCNTCHGLMDPLGFALEGFDAVGRERAMERFAGSPIDTSGMLPSGERIAGVDDLRVNLAGDSEQFAMNLTEKLYLFALGRQLDPRDMPAIRKITHATQPGDYRFFDIVSGIVHSDAFTHRRVPAAGDAGETPTDVVQLK